MAKKYEYITKSFTYEGQRYFVRGKTEQEAIFKMANKIRDLQDGKYALSGNMTVEAWALKANEVYRPNQKEVTRHAELNKMKSAIFDYIGSRPLKSIRKIELQELLNKQAGHSKSHIRKVRQLMQFIFSTALTEKLIREDPSVGLIEPSGYKHTRRQLTEEEREHYMKVRLDDDRFVAFDLMLFCGLRPSEAQNVRGSDVRVMSNAAGEEYHVLHVPGTKTANAERFVPIPGILFSRVQSVPADRYICTTVTGVKHTENSFRWSFHALKRAMNISMGCKLYRNELVPPYPLADDFVPYNFRHTYCCDLQKANVDIRTAQQLMGHSDISLTANIYSHADNMTVISAADQLREYASSKMPRDNGVTNIP